MSSAFRGTSSTIFPAVREQLVLFSGFAMIRGGEEYSIGTALDSFSETKPECKDGTAIIAHGSAPRDLKMPCAQITSNPDIGS